MKKYFNNRLMYNPSKKICIYYQDRDKRWKFFTGEHGFNLLIQCLKNVKKIHKKYSERYHIDKKNGLSIYTNKKKYITWTNEDYENPNFRYVYTTFKSFQRFTEMYSLLERFKSYHSFTNKSYSVLSIGCGPGFESYSFDLYLEKKNVFLYGIDIIEDWKEDFESHGSNYRFIGNKVIGNKEMMDLPQIDFVILSNVFANHMMNDQGFEVIRFLMIERNVSFLLVNDRSKNVDINDFCTENKLFFYPLISVNDHRQFFLSKNKYKSHNSKIIKYTFPNVPFSFL